MNARLPLFAHNSAKPSTARRFPMPSCLPWLSLALSFAACATVPTAPSVADILPNLSPLASTLASLPPAAQAAADQGLLAMKQQDYLSAIQSFQKARETDSAAPELFFNLGLAEASVPGRELRAICWLSAYLAASPHAPNAPIVWDLIAALEIKTQDNFARLLTSVQEAEKSNDYADGPVMRDVAVLWAESGDFSAAINTSMLIQNDGLKYRAQSDIAVVQAGTGDLVGAQKTFALALKTVERYDSVYNAVLYGAALVRITQDDARSNIVTAQVQAGDFAGARHTAALIQNADLKRQVQRDLAATSPTATPVSAGVPAITVSAWLAKLADNNPMSDCPLNTLPFLDLDAYLAYRVRQTRMPYMGSLPADSPVRLFKTLQPVIHTIAKAQAVIGQMLKQQAKQ